MGDEISETTAAGMSTSPRPSVSRTPERQPGGYRELILQRLQRRNKQVAQFQSIYASYTAVLDELQSGGAGTSRQQRMRIASESTAASPSTAVALAVDGQLSALRFELMDAFTKKAEVERQLKDSQAHIVQLESQLVVEKKRGENLEKETERRRELEEQLQSAKDRLAFVQDEHIALQAMYKSAERKLADAEADRAQLLDKIVRLQEREANLHNQELEWQQKQTQKRIQEELASALASDPTLDERARRAVEDAEKDGFAYFGDIVPESRSFKMEATGGENYDVCWMDETHFAVAGSDKRVHIVRLLNGRQEKLATLVGCNAGITRLDFEPLSRLLLGSSNDNTIRVWAVDAQRCQHTLSGHTDKVTTARFHSARAGVPRLISGASDRSIKLWDLTQGRCVRTYFPGSTVLDVGARGFASGTFVSGHLDKKIRLWDERTDEPLRIIEMNGKVTSLAQAMDAHTLLASVRDNTLSVLDLRTTHTLHTYSAEQYATASDFARCTFSPGGDYCAAGAANGHVFVWSTTSTRLEKVLHKAGHEHPVLSVAWCPSGRGLLSADRQRTVCLWN